MQYKKKNEQTERQNTSIQRYKRVVVGTEKDCKKKNKNKSGKKFIFYNTHHAIRSPSFFSFVKLISLLLLSFNSNTLYAQDETEENTSYTPVFRSGHTLSLLTSWDHSTWNVSQNSASSFGTISSLSETRLGVGLYLRYAYHINIVSNFGFFLGTTAGLLLPVSNYGSLKPVYGYAFPTVMGGLSLNFSQNYRLLTGAEYGAAWFPDMTILTDTTSTAASTSRALAPVPDVFSYFVGLDYFYKKNLALSFQTGYRLTKITCLNNCSSTSFLNTLSINNKSIFAQLGLTFQVSEFR
ncbi:hypothetical protein [Fluviispira multicolorata]|uniref:Outer membrane protein beta-barrel domain-containing protein n=1 Tax=Fluviispira multicolorata TaxID=2654512 RepID=A0A833JED4_9BACT|nr:hypothetical protein [Fluviispira multicolorata]KAB8029794.1 hypothetical protein GCL57_09645 [Fluviispira multicolorata]